MHPVLHHHGWPVANVSGAMRFTLRSLVALPGQFQHFSCQVLENGCCINCCLWTNAGIIPTFNFEVTMDTTHRKLAPWSIFRTGWLFQFAYLKTWSSGLGDSCPFLSLRPWTRSLVCLEHTTFSLMISKGAPYHDWRKKRILKTKKRTLLTFDWPGCSTLHQKSMCEGCLDIQKLCYVEILRDDMFLFSIFDYYTHSCV